MLACVDAPELLDRGARRLDELEAKPIPPRELFLDRYKAPGALGMPAGVVPKGRLVTDIKAHGLNGIRGAQPRDS